jgi:hypothetical protein
MRSALSLPCFLLPYLAHCLANCSPQTVLQPGLRLISLDTTYGMFQNFWLLLSSVSAYYTDVAGQMAWFNQTLALAQVKSHTELAL